MTGMELRQKRMPTPKVAFSQTPFLLLLNLSFGGILLLGAVLAHGVESIDFEIFILLLGLYAVATVYFLVSRARSGRFHVFDIPTFTTVLCFVRFGLVPLSSFLDPELLDPFFHRGDYSLLNRALCYFMLGMLGFWAGCSLVVKKPGKTADPPPETGTEAQAPTRSPVDAMLVLLMVSLATKIYIFKNFGWGYAMSMDVYFKNLALLQVLLVIAELGIYVLAIAAIEMHFHPGDDFRRILFVVAFTAELFWGALSGMKLPLFRGFLLVAMIASIRKGKLEKRWLAAIVLGFVLIYPISDRYRALLRGGKVDVTGFNSLEQAGDAAVQQTAERESGWRGWLANGYRRTLTRLDLLQLFAVVLSLDAHQLDRLQGDERLWMIPFYPFIPRFMWKSKPVLMRAGKLSLVLGAGSETATALTYPGDLYVDYGVGGMVVGMFLLGVIGQVFTNWITGPYEKRDLFFYTAMFVGLANVMEGEAFPAWSGLIRNVVLVGALTYAIYGGRRARASPRRRPA